MRRVSCAPSQMPGSEPISRAPSRLQSTWPSVAWPMPATSVSGTAWAMSVPTRRCAARRGYSSRISVAPMAPAPIDDSVTSTPSSDAAGDRQRRLARFGQPALQAQAERLPACLDRRRPPRSAAARCRARRSARLAQRLGRARWRASARSCQAAGRLPASSRRGDAPVDVAVARVSATAPPVLVRAANHRSVPIASGRVQLEHADQQRRHQRAAADAGHADDDAHGKSRRMAIESMAAL